MHIRCLGCAHLRGLHDLARCTHNTTEQNGMTIANLGRMQSPTHQSVAQWPGGSSFCCSLWLPRQRWYRVIGRRCMFAYWVHLLQVSYVIHQIGDLCKRSYFVLQMWNSVNPGETPTQVRLGHVINIEGSSPSVENNGLIWRKLVFPYTNDIKYNHTCLTCFYLE